MKLRGKFSEEFLLQIPLLEKEMRAHDLSPDDFSISKTSGASRGYSAAMGDNYTVRVQNEVFTVNMPTDAQFLKYFYKICFPPEESSPMHTGQHKLTAILQRMKNWLTKDPLQES